MIDVAIFPARFANIVQQQADAQIQEARSILVLITNPDSFLFL